MLSPEEAEAHSQAVADVLNSVLTSQIQIVDAEKEEGKLKNLIAESSTDPGSGKRLSCCSLCCILHRAEYDLEKLCNSHQEHCRSCIML